MPLCTPGVRYVESLPGKGIFGLGPGPELGFAVAFIADWLQAGLSGRLISELGEIVGFSASEGVVVLASPAVLPSEL